MKRLLLASDSFKGTLSSSDIASIAKDVIEERFQGIWSLDYQLLADGGEGTVDVFSSLWGEEKRWVSTVDAEGTPIKAPIITNKEGDALFEVASVVGLPLIKGKIPPLERSTKGIGVLIKEAIRLGAKRIYVGLGGSSTNDLGIGMLSELGIVFKGASRPVMQEAPSIQGVDCSSFFLQGKGIQFVCLSDVRNPLLGQNGATYVYGPQKGYGPYLEKLEKEMGRIASFCEKATSKSLQNLPGLGAAGGLGAAFYAFMDAKIASGIEMVLQASNFKERAAKADLIITGEGSFDEQSLQGKVYTGVAKFAPKEKLVVLCGRSEIKNPEVAIYEASRPGESFEYIKKHARESYAKALTCVLELYK